VSDETEVPDGGPQADRLRHALSFGAAADLYERVRPGYPPAAVGWVLDAVDGPVRRVLDLGAGTGKLTRTLLDVAGPAVEVVAVDPDAAMLDRLTTAVPAGSRVRPRTGSAERLPLAEASVDAVLCAQAWHWVDPAAAVPEVARVLRPGGVLGLLWNLRDERTDWVAAFGQASGTTETAVDDPELSPGFEPPFGAVEQLEVPHEVVLDPADLPSLAASRSHLLVLQPGERAVVLDGVRALAATHPDLTGRDAVPMPYRTLCRRYRR